MPMNTSLESHGQESFVGAADTRAISGRSSSEHEHPEEPCCTSFPNVNVLDPMVTDRGESCPSRDVRRAVRDLRSRRKKPPIFGIRDGWI